VSDGGGAGGAEVAGVSDTAKSKERKAKSSRAGGSTLGRRAELAVLTALFIFANAVSALLVVRLGDRYSARVDVTATLEHRLAENTRRALERAAGAGAGGGGVEIVIAAPLDGLDPRARVAVGDVLDEIQRRSDAVRVTRIDTGSGAGLTAFESLLQRLRDRDQRAMDEYLAAVEAAMGQLEELAAYFESDFPAAFGAIAAALEGASGDFERLREHFSGNAARAPAQAMTLRDQLAAAGTLLNPTAETIVPAADRAGAVAADALISLAPTLAQMAQSARNSAREPGFPARAQATAVAGQLDHLAAASAEAADRLSRQATPDLIRVARAIQGAQAALVIGPPELGVAAIQFEALFPPAPVIDSAGAGPSALRQRAEELISTTLLSLAEPIKPIVVFVHGEAQPLLNTGVFRLVRERLALRGIDTLEWAAVLDEAPPDIGALDPTGVRPVVYAVHNTDTLAGGRDPSGRTFSGPDRAVRLGRAINQIVRAGEPLLLSLQRSTLPTFGDDDPTAGVLSEFALRAQTGRPLLVEGPPGTRHTVETEHMVRAAAAGEDDFASALALAIERLPTILSWPVPLERIEPPQGVRLEMRTLYAIDSDRAWGEADWVGLARIPPEQRSLVPNPPAPDSPRDDTDGPWDVAVAVERRMQGSEPQRLVAVGSSGWFISQIVGAATEVDGRRAPLFAGNGELFEASVLWLARQDHLIARTPAAGSAPAIGEIGEAETRWLRWGLIAGLPLLVLALGGAGRLLRR
jgi:hypothetical protein